MFFIYKDYSSFKDIYRYIRIRRPMVQRWYKYKMLIFRKFKTIFKYRTSYEKFIGIGAKNFKKAL